MSVEDEDIALRRHLEVMGAIDDLSHAQQVTANEVLALRAQLVPGLRPHAFAHYYPHFASTVALVLAGAIALGACKP